MNNKKTQVVWFEYGCEISDEIVGNTSAAEIMHYPGFVDIQSENILFFNANVTRRIMINASLNGQQSMGVWLASLKSFLSVRTNHAVYRLTM